VRVLGGFRATSVRAGRSVCCHGTRRAPLGDFGSGAVAAGNEGRKEVGCGREGGTGRAGGRRRGGLLFLSFPFSRVILKREVAEVSLAGSVVSDGFQEAIINPTDVDG
jgi:hypothetical protein